ncbi:MAG: DUF6932 family protein [Methanothrix sp.]
MIPDFDANGNLPPGDLIRPTIKEFEDRFVNAEAEKVRREIYEGYRNYCKCLIALGVVSIQWIDGSYTTKKPSPNDIDLVVHFDGMKIYLDKNLQIHFKNLIDINEMKRLYRCHPQFVLIYPQSEPDLYSYYILRYQHWLKWFSKDRNGNAKGLIEFDIQKNNYKSENENGGEVNHAQGT